MGRGTYRLTWAGARPQPRTDEHETVTGGSRKEKLKELPDIRGVLWM